MPAPDRWPLVERLFYEALDRPPADRASFLAARCGDDAELRHDVESLLAAEPHDDWKPDIADAGAADWAGAGRRPLVGRVIDGYRVTSPLGAGGMGEVFLAEDLSLGRKVALKLLPGADTASPSRLRRFADEARAASGLNHPGILTVYHVGTVDGRPYIAAEFVDGMTVRDRLRSGPIAIEAAIDIALQTAGALAAAHEAGIVHRDVKPENLMIRRDGFVKVLDFGLAKLRREPAMPGTTSATTLTGVIVGTVDYMAPEQAAGIDVDPRADIYSLAVVVYEMLTGSLPRELGGPARGSGAARGALDRDAMAILQRGLATDPARRYQTMRAFAADLATLRKPGWRRGLRHWPIAAGVIVAAIAVAGAGWWRLRQPPADGVTSLLVMPLRQLSADPDQSHLELGLADAIASRLTGLPHLRVAPTAAVRPQEDPFVAAARLGVDAVLIGTVQRDGDQLRVTAQLSRATDHREIWASRFDQHFTDVFTVEDTIAERIATNLPTGVSPDGRAALTRHETQNADAYDLYLRAREQWARRTPETVHLAIQMYQHAIALDPDFSLAYAGLADCYSLTASGLAPAVRFPLAKAAAARAIALDPQSGPAHTALAFMLYKFAWKWTDAEREFQRAIDLEPDYPLAHHWYGEFLKLEMRHDESIHQFRRAVELDPFSIPIRYDYISALLNAGRVADARAVLEDSKQLDPTAARILYASADVLKAEGHLAESVDEGLKGDLLQGLSEADAAERRAAFRTGGMAAMYGKTAEQMLRHAGGDTSALRAPLLATGLAGVYANLQDRERTMTWLLAAADRDEDAPLLMKTHAYDFVRNDPRFQALLHRVGLAQ